MSTNLRRSARIAAKSAAKNIYISTPHNQINFADLTPIQLKHIFRTIESLAGIEEDDRTDEIFVRRLFQDDEDNDENEQYAIDIDDFAEEFAESLFPENK